MKLALISVLAGATLAFSAPSGAAQSIVSWGLDNYGQVSNTPIGTGFTQVSAGGNQNSVALRADGSIASWGNDGEGQVSNTPGGTGFTQVSAGGGHSHALRDGSITQPFISYCTAGTSASGCTATLSALGTSSATFSTGFTVLATSVEGAKNGLFFFGSNGRQANSWGSGFQCVVPPVKRTGLMLGIGTSQACDGAFSVDLNAHWAAKPNHNPGPGAVVQAQLWYRDPWNTATTKTTTLSDAIEFTVGP